LTIVRIDADTWMEFHNVSVQSGAGIGAKVANVTMDRAGRFIGVALSYGLIFSFGTEGFAEVHNLDFSALQAGDYMTGIRVVWDHLVAEDRLVDFNLVVWLRK